MTDAASLAPTWRKLAITVACFLLFPALMVLRAIPPRWDLLDLREWSGKILALLIGVPIRLFDILTRSAFASRNEGFLGFPSLPELIAAALADALLFYLCACAWVHWQVRGRAETGG